MESEVPQHVVVGVDGSDGGWRALEWAMDAADTHKVPLTVLHCARADQATRDSAMRRVRARQVSVPVEARLVAGAPSVCLEQAVGPVDLLVVGMRLRRRWAARMLGSTTSHLLSQPPSAVTVVPPLRSQRQGPFNNHVVAALDTPTAAERILPWVVAEASSRHLPVVAVRAEPPPAGPHGAYVDPQMLEVVLSPVPTSFGMLEDTLLPWQHRYPQLTLRRACFQGTPANVFRHVATGAALLVMGQPTHGPQFLHLADMVLAEATCPVMVTPARVTAEPPSPRATGDTARSAADQQRSRVPRS